LEDDTGPPVRYAAVLDTRPRVPTNKDGWIFRDKMLVGVFVIFKYTLSMNEFVENDEFDDGADFW
jgi:hypothetical protein